MKKVKNIKNYDDIYKLRLNSLAKSDFKISPQSLAIDQKDYQGIHLGIYQNGELVSALRLFDIHNASELERQLDFKEAHLLDLKYPVRVIGKANTHPNFKNKGLMKKILEEVFKNYQQHPLVLTTKPTNPLIHYLEKNGFKKVVNPDGWSRFGYFSGGQTYIFYQ